METFFQRNVVQKHNESNPAYNARKMLAQRNGPVFQFEIDGSRCDLKLSTGETTEAEVHRILLYKSMAEMTTLRRRGGPSFTSPKLQGCVEMKIKRFIDNENMVASAQPATLIKCVSNRPYTLSLIVGKSYTFAGEEILIHGARFLKVIDESEEGYFYPHNLFNILRV